MENNVINHPFIITTITTKPFLQPFITILKLREKCFTTRRESRFSTFDHVCYPSLLFKRMHPENLPIFDLTVNNMVQGNGFIVLSPFFLKFLPQLIIFPVILA